MQYCNIPNIIWFIIKLAIYVHVIPRVKAHIVIVNIPKGYFNLAKINTFNQLCISTSEYSERRRYPWKLADRALFGFIRGSRAV